jgi:nucleoside-triphosphatase
MSVRIAVTGQPGCGKTTLVRRVVERVGSARRVGGLYTEEIRRGGVRSGFAIVDIMTGARGTLASVEGRAGPAVGTYRVSLEGITTVAIPAIEAAAAGADIIVVDEIAPMECASPAFVAAVERLLDGTKPLLFAIHGKARVPVLDRIREEFQVVTVTPANRDELVATIAERLQGAKP